MVEETREDTETWEKLRKLYEKVDKPALLLLTATIIFWIYIARITYPAPNYDAELDKLIYGPTNWTGNIEALKHVNVPPTQVKTEHIAIGITLSILLFYRLTHKELRGGVIGEKKARKIAEEHIRQLQQQRMPEVMGEIIPGNYTLKHVGVEGSKQEPQKYVIETRIRQSANNTNYFIQDIDAKTGEKLRMLPRNEPFTGKDICERCGGNSDIKIILPESMKDHLRAFGRFKEVR